MGGTLQSKKHASATSVIIIAAGRDGAEVRRSAGRSATVRAGAQPPKYQPSNRVRHKLCPATGMPGLCDRVRHGAEQYRMRIRATGSAAASEVAEGFLRRRSFDRTQRKRGPR